MSGYQSSQKILRKDYNYKRECTFKSLNIISADRIPYCIIDGRWLYPYVERVVHSAKQETETREATKYAYNALSLKILMKSALDDLA